jgi:membrane peptidoglycan carboxypeptidase
LRSAAEVSVEVPLASCSALLAAVPHGMAPLLEGVRMEGTFALKGGVTYDSEKPLQTRTSLEVNNQCRVAEAPGAISPRRFQNPWLREVKGVDGSPMSIESGPGTPDWTPYEGISPFLETAVVVCEDAGFFSHRGIDYRAIENSIRMNLEAGKFLRGGSTVTMQLAKNLYLSKEKTITRKLQEAVLTLLLEQQLSKHELMELYLNVIEFGPGIYGVRQAARYYFNEEPRALSLGQALYLGSILPAPDSQHFRPDGHVSPGWGQYLKKLMQVARKIRRISEDELAAGLSEEVVFREPSLLAREAPPSEDIPSDEALEPAP